MTRTPSLRGGLVGAAMVSALTACAASAPSKAEGAPPLALGRGAASQGSACHVGTVTGCGDHAPSFAQDVQPILQRRCFRCHSGEGVAAEEHDFSRIQVLQAQKSQVTGEISTCAMPPRSPIPETEAHTLLEWVACGAHGD